MRRISYPRSWLTGAYSASRYLCMVRVAGWGPYLPSPFVAHRRVLRVQILVHGSGRRLGEQLGLTFGTSSQLSLVDQHSAPRALTFRTTVTGWSTTPSAWRGERALHLVLRESADSSATSERNPVASVEAQPDGRKEQQPGERPPATQPPATDGLARASSRRRMNASASARKPNPSICSSNRRNAAGVPSAPQRGNVSSCAAPRPTSVNVNQESNQRNRHAACSRSRTTSPPPGGGLVRGQDAPRVSKRRSSAR